MLNFSENLDIYKTCAQNYGNYFGNLKLPENKICGKKLPARNQVTHITILVAYDIGYKEKALPPPDNFCYRADMAGGLGGMDRWICLNIGCRLQAFF